MKDVHISDVHKADMVVARRAIAASKLPSTPRPHIQPTENPAWDQHADWGTTAAPDGARTALTKLLEKPAAVQDSMLDQWMLELRIAGNRFATIAEKIGEPYTEEYVAQRIGELLAKTEKINVVQARALQNARLEGLLTICFQQIHKGSDVHIELGIKILERIAKLFELEKETNRVELQYIDEANQRLFEKTLDIVVANIRKTYEAILKQHNIMPPDPEIIDGTIADALDESHQMIKDAVDAPLVLERKGNQMVLVNANLDG